MRIINSIEEAGPGAFALDVVAQYDLLVVGLSYVVAFVGCYVAISILRYYHAVKRAAVRYIALALGSLVLATAIWSMHYVGMMAYAMSMRHAYDPAMTIFSGVIALVFASGVYVILAQQKLLLKDVLVAAPVLGIGVAAMHYSGMEAMQAQAQMYYLAGRFLASVLVAILASGAAIYLMHLARSSEKKFAARQMAVALIMALAVTGMHYIGMSATVFVPDADCRFDGAQDSMEIALIVASIAGAIFTLGGGYIALSSAKNKRLAIQIPLLSLVVCVLLGGAVLFVESTLVRDEMLKHAKLERVLAGRLIAYHLETDLDTAQTLAKSVALTAQTLPKEEALFKQVLVNLIGHGAPADFVAGGGYWPEPNAFKPGIDRRSFFWGREKDGSLKYYDDYNDPKGAGYHHEEWYVPARFKKDGDCYWSKSYVDPYSYQPMITCTIAIVDGDEGFAGVSTIDVKLEGIAEEIQKDVKAFEGYGFLVDRNNKLISFPEGVDVRVGGAENSAQSKEFIDMRELVRRQPEYAPIAKVLEDINQKMLEGESSSQALQIAAEMDAKSEQINAQEAKLIERLLAHGNSVHISSVEHQDFTLEQDPLLKTSVSVDVYRLPETNWKLVTVAPYSVVTEQAAAISQKLMKLSLLIILALIGIFYFILNRILLRPIRGIIAQLSGANAEELQAPLNEAINNELGEIAFWYNRRAGELLNARKHADQANATKSEFLANMSHELRTPLNSIIGLAKLMKETPLSPEQNEMVDTVTDSSESLLEIVNDILDLSKIENGSLELESISFEPRACLMRVVNMLIPSSSKKRLILQTHFEGLADVNVMGDPVRFTRILTNLIGNAIKYTEKGRVDIYFKVIQLDENRALVNVRVKDTGIGIPPEKLDKVFEKFVQADTSTTRKYGGSGLGLAITKQLVEMMAGTISLESTLGQGSTFMVNIPFAVASSEVVVGETLAAPTFCGTLPAARARVLLAEDHLLNQAFMRKLLPTMGITQFTIVDNGEDARTEALSGNYDIVLMDCHMPKMNGYDATRAIREGEQGSGQHIPIIAMTANAMIGEREHCMRLGMDEYISKPIERDKLREIMGHWIRFPDAPKSAAKNSVDEGSLAVLDLTILRTFSAGEVEMEREFAGIFMLECDKHFTTLEQAIVDGESHAWKEAAHAIKGGAATIGALRLRALGTEAQNMLSATADERRTLYTQMQQAYADACARLREMGLID